MANPFEKSSTSKNEYACTVVNLLPIELNESKPHMLPSMHLIPAATKNGPGLAYIKEGIHYVPNPLIEEGKPGSSIKQTTSPMEMARSICDDFNSAQVALSEDARPGLFWVEGRLTFAEIEKYHAAELEYNLQVQKNWYRNLVNMADSDWNKNHNMLAVSDLQRIAARAIGLKKDWVDFINPDDNMKCPFCQVTINSSSVICMNCKQVVNQKKFQELSGVKSA